MDNRYITVYWRKVIRGGDDECWGWSGTISHGYGVIDIWSKDRKRYVRMGAHRVSLFIATGQISEQGSDTLHLCHTPICTNPAHLKIGSRAENMRGSQIAGRMQRRIPLNDIPRIIERRTKGHTLSQIAKDYGCSKQAVRHMIRVHGVDPVKRHINTMTYKGETLTLRQWAERTGIPHERLRHRYIRAGWSAADTLSKPPVKTGRPPKLAPWEERFPERDIAGKIVRYEVRKGRLTRQPCQKCGSTHYVQGHHEDYSKPLEVQWLCRSCHNEVHKVRPWRVA